MNTHKQDTPVHVATAKILNLATGRIHVAWFSRRPWPGDRAACDDAVIRWQSRMHHTDGAETEEQADLHMSALQTSLARIGYTHAADLGCAEWNGDGIPAMVLLGPNPPVNVRSI